MEKIQISKYIKLGQLLCSFENENECTNIDLFNRVTNFLDIVDELNLQVTKRALSSTNIYYKYYRPLESQIQSKPKEKATKEMISDVNNEIRKVLITFESEVATRQVFVLKDKKYDIECLIDDPRKLFRDPKLLLFAEMDVQFNIFEAAKCLAFEVYTASAYHILLATEGYLRQLISKLIEAESENFDVHTATFFPLIKKAEQLLGDEKNHHELTTLLHLIRRNYRNQSFHSNRKFTENETTELFEICIKIMNGLYSIMEQKELFGEE